MLRCKDTNASTTTMRQTHKGKATPQHQTPRSAGAQPHKKREGGGVGCRNGGGRGIHMGRSLEGWNGREGGDWSGGPYPIQERSGTRACVPTPFNERTHPRTSNRFHTARTQRSSPGHLYLQAVQTHPLTHTFGRNATLVHTRGAIIISKATYI